MKSANEDWFDAAYYERFYFDKKTSVVDHGHVERLGAFVCSYLQYLRVPVARVLDVGCGIGSAADAKKALQNLGRLCRGALYVEAVTREDWEQGILDEDLTDDRMFRHRAQLYRQGLEKEFTQLGGGVWLSRQAELPLFALECLKGE